MFAHVKKAKAWEGRCCVKKKSGDIIRVRCSATPVIDQDRRIGQVVYTYAPHSEVEVLGDIQNSVTSLKDADLPPLPNDIYYRRGSVRSLINYTGDLRSMRSEGGVRAISRRPSMARIHSMTIEAPITKVVNMIYMAQDNCPNTVIPILDKVIDILRSSELYSPFTENVSEQDEMSSEYVEGLMSRTMRKHSQQGLASPGGVGTAVNARYPLPPSGPPMSLTTASPDIRVLIEKDQTWDIDVLELERISNKRPLLYLGLKIFSRLGVGEYLHCSERVLQTWLQLIEQGYHSTNSYHNSTHAADVLQATAYFLSRDRLKDTLTKQDQVGSVIAAAIHDVDHPGRTNVFLANAQAPLALCYNDRAILENHHAAHAFRVTLADDSCNIFKNLPMDEYKQLREIIVDMVLATEMTKHFEHVNKFVTSINTSRVTDDDRSSVLSSHLGHEVDLMSSENRALVKRMIIKCADIANPCRPLALCKEWANRIAEEYFRQTTEEKERGLPVVMPVFDRNTCNIPKSQTTFMDIFIMNTFDAWDNFADVGELMENLQANYDYWQSEAALIARKAGEQRAESLHSS
ncbi:PREDICTED: high affinity cAMP-specific and IBMX-insensitive 3',5'-cyclic phosphodiesterase 8A-like [Priapulus caudatus]|uniref:Phosphodiesterase n=1 Tax=Priapulus caudatus TaxID=37621 RepID=A0ABM1DZW2_PRICU|nr:PREDICTED: high affinity cAMP-specific and IBMX-insensitive 3',5'-cyclic phosphodiesterase 8A-like [Priapulus caudatus]